MLELGRERMAQEEGASLLYFFVPLPFYCTGTQAIIYIPLTQHLFKVTLNLTWFRKKNIFFLILRFIGVKFIFNGLLLFAFCLSLYFLVSLSKS